MSQFEDFDKMYGSPENCEKPDDEAINAYDGFLPKELLDTWREFGWCSYHKGLLWVVDPQQFNGIVEDWVNFDTGCPLVILRSAFAHLYLWHEGYVYSLDVQHGSLSQVTQNIKRIFSFLCNPELREKILRVSLFEQALQRLGELNRDECYAFEPALAIGGPGTVDSIRRVKIREHLGLLAQMVLGE